MTILFGENGTGKTGYSRIFKALAGSRTADAILGDITFSEEVPQSAKVEYTVGTEANALVWAGEQGVAPFTRMSIFDSPAVNFHVDDDLEYVYVPAALSLFNHVNTALRAVHDRVDAAMRGWPQAPRRSCHASLAIQRSTHSSKRSALLPTWSRWMRAPIVGRMSTSDSRSCAAQ